MNPKIIPDAYTEYEDGRIGAVAARLANVEAKIGAADAGEIGKLYVFAGGDAKAQAKAIFQGGPLLQAIEEAFDAGSSTVYAWRIGGAGTAAELTLVANSGADNAILLQAAQTGEDGNGITIEVDDEALLSLTAGVSVLDNTTSPNTIRKKDQSGATIPGSAFNLAANIDGRGHIDVTDSSGNVHWVVGLDTADLNKPKAWYYNNTHTLVPAETIDLSGLLTDFSSGEIPKAIPFVFVATPPDPGTMLLYSNTHVYAFDPADKAPTVAGGAQRQAWTDLGLLTPNIVGGGLDFDILAGGGPTGLWAACAQTSNLYRLAITGGGGLNFTLDGTFNFGALIGGWTLTGFFFDPFNNECYFNVIDGWGCIVTDRPTADLVAADEKRTVQVGFTGDDCENSTVAFTIADIEHGLGITAIDTGDPAPTPIQYLASKTGGQACRDLVDAINADGSLITATLLTETNDLDAVSPAVNLSGGAGGGGELTNGDFIAGLDLTTGKSEISWIHLVGARSNALWTAAIVHCNQMLELYNSERFAILETPLFETTANEGTAEYLADLQTYVDALIAMMDTVANRNAVIFAGGAQFIDSDGNIYIAPITAACGGTIASLEVQKSLINKNVKNVISLVPEFSPGQLQQLIQARMNAIRLKPGRGFIISHSLTGAAPGSDYSRANDLRAVYYGGKAARDAAQPLVGEENDELGEGLARLESAMSRPLEVMRDGGQIDDFELVIKSDANDRLLGDVYCELGIQPLRAMEMIYTTVYLK
jgi:Protein of unknown function (DUF2586)